MGKNIIMAMVKLPSLKLYWLSDDAFANSAIKKTMSRNHFFERNSLLHFNNADREPACGEGGFDPRTACSLTRELIEREEKPSKTFQ